MPELASIPSYQVLDRLDRIIKLLEEERNVEVHLVTVASQDVIHEAADRVYRAVAAMIDRSHQAKGAE